MKNTTTKQLHFNIKEELKARKKTKKKLCSEMKVNINYLNQLKDGSPIWKIKMIADYIGCTPSDLLKGI